MRSTMVEALTKVEVQSSENVKQTADALAPLLETPDEVTEETQVILVFMQSMKILDFNWNNSCLEANEKT